MMNRLKAFILLFLLSQIATAMADNFRCSAYYLQPSNTLDRINIFNPTDDPKYPASIVPNYESSKGHVITQIWKLAPYRNAPLFVTCLYQKGNAVTKAIPVNVNTCQLIFIQETPTALHALKAEFECYYVK